jgi:hypothetical protein
MGGVENGGTIVPSDNRIFTKYTAEVPLTATFTIISWELAVSNAPMTVKGMGGQLSPNAMSMLKQAKKGSIVTLNVKTIGPDKIVRNRVGSFRL